MALRRARAPEHRPIDGREEPIRIALDAAASGESAVVIPRSSRRPDDYLILPGESADVALLHAGILRVLELRRATPRDQHGPIVVRRPEGGVHLPESWKGRLEGALAQLRAARPEQHPTLGRVAVIEFRILGAQQRA